MKLTDYYGKAIRANANSIDDMKTAIFATLHHAVSTDENPNHAQCPEGENSWCIFRRAEAKNEPNPGPHKKLVHTPLTQEIHDFIKPVYERLSDSSLLERCTRGATQNANESLHSVLWNVCSKASFVGAQKLNGQIAVTVGRFNKGASGLAAPLIGQNLETGFYFTKHAQTIDKKRLTQGEKQIQESSKAARTKKKMDKLTKEAKHASKESDYGPGIDYSFENYKKRSNTQSKTKATKKAKRTDKDK